MFTLPFRQIANVEQMLDQHLIEDLVLVFCSQAADEYLLVYNCSCSPPLHRDGWNSICLDSLTPEDYHPFNGPVIGFSALDVVFKDIPTHGVNFYHIYQIFERKQQLTQYQQTAYHLAKWLWENKERFTGREQRGYRKIIELALPQLLQNQALENLVAVLPDPDFSIFLQGDNLGLRRIYIEDLAQFKAANDKCWIIAFEEILTLHPIAIWDQAYWFDLRLVFRQLQQPSALRQTCLRLARYYWQQWQITQIDTFKNTAYALAAEAWVMENEVEDLIALLPHSDFERFVSNADVIRIGRIYQINQKLESNEQRIGLMELAEPDRLRQRIKDYQGPFISFPVLAPLLNRLTNGPVLDLASVLFHTQREPELARTFWLISSDLLKFAQFPLLAASPDQITDLAQRSSLIYSLSNPWLPLWRARYSHLIALVYSHLVECFTNQEKRARESGLSDYYRALREWHDCYLSQDIPHSLASVQNACRDFMANTQRRTDLQSQQKITGRLVWVTNQLLRPDIVSNMPGVAHLPSHLEVVDYLRQTIIQQNEPVDVFSPNFEDLLHAYAELHASWRNLQHNTSGKLLSSDVLNGLKADYTVLPNMAYVPAHELRLIQWACQRDLGEIESWAQALQLGPVLEIQVLNHQMIIGKQEHLFVDIKNAGAAAAHDFELSLMPSQQLEILGYTQPMLPATFEAGQSLRLEWNMRTASSPVKLNFSYRFRKLDGKLHSGEIAVAPVEAIPARVAGNPPHDGNPFQAGVPVFGDRFYGRTKEIKEILQVLLGEISQPILLRGPRRIGKSSVLHQLKYLLTQEGEIRSLGFSLEDERALMHIHPVIASFHELPSSRQFIPGWFSGLFKEICQSVGETYDSQALREDFQSDPVREFRHHIQRLFRKFPDVRLLVMIDEWDEQRNLADLGKNLRNIMQTESRVNWIVSSTWVLQADAGNYGSPFYNQCMAIELKNMSWDSAATMVHDLSNLVGADWQGEAMVTLLDQTGRRPYLMQLLCQQVVRDLYEQSSTFVDTDMIGRVIGNFIATPQASGQALGFLWEKDLLSSTHVGEARLHWLGRLILWAIDQTPTELTYQQIKDHILTTLGARCLQVQEENFASFFNEEFTEQIPELEYIFDIIRIENQLLLFSIPLVRNWFHQMLRQYPDPFLHAYQGMMQEYAQWKKVIAGKEKKK